MVGYIFLLIFVLTTIISFYRIQIGFALVVACRLLIPAIVRIDLKVVELSLNSCFIFMLMGLIALNFITKKARFPQTSKMVLRPVLILLAVLFVITLLSQQLDISQRVNSLIQFIYTEIVLGIIGWIIYTNEKEINLFVKITGVTAVLMSVYGLFCYATLTNPYISLMNLMYSPKMDALGFMEEQRAGVAGRIQGTMTHPLTWGGSCLLLFYFLFVGIKKFPLYVNLVVLGLLFVNVVFSGSRSALLALLAGLGYFFLTSNVKLKIKFVSYSFGLLISLISLIYLVPSFEKYQVFFESTLFFWDESYNIRGDIKGSSASMRFAQLAGSFDMIESSPFFGLGQGYTKYYSATYGVHPILAGFESIIFMALVETGIVGLILWIVFFLSLFRLVQFIKGKLRQSSLFYATLLSTFIAAFCIFIVFTGIQSTFYLFFILFMIQVKHLTLTQNLKKKKVVQNSVVQS